MQQEEGSGNGRECERVQNVGYRDPANAQQRLDLYLPSDTYGKPPPLLVYIHGGAWVDRSKDAYGHIGRCFASKGIAVAVIDYTLSPKRRSSTVHPVHTNDVAAAVHWLKTNAQTYGYDPQRIFLFGHSAGAHMSGLLALDPSYLSQFGESAASSLRGIVGASGIYDLVLLNQECPTYKELFTIFAFGEESKWKDASPQHCPSHKTEGGVPVSVPWLLFHSEEDELCPINQTTRFREHLQQLGIPVQMGECSGSHYAVVDAIGDEGKDQLTAQILKFIQESS
ncbi:Alpha/beta hydrolase [Balamuthia mandrillaris]